MRWLAALWIFTVGAGVAGAHSTGITRVSGKSGSICNQCHSGGATPTVALTGPATIAAGAQATYTFTITGGAAVAGGLDAALDDASLAAGAKLATISSLTQILNGEVTHTQPSNFASGALSFQFAVVAPSAARTMTLWVAGNSTNHDGTSSGDKAAGTMMTITVAAAAPPPDFAGAPAGADLSIVTNPPPDASDLAVTPTPSGRDLATPAGAPGSEGPPAGAPSPPHMMATAQGGCSLAAAAEAPSTLALLLLALGYVAAAFALAAAFSRRARRRSASPAPPAPSASASARARR